MIVNLKNNGVAVYNITDCMGSLNDANNFAIYHQNVRVKRGIRRSSLRETSTRLCTLDMR